MSLINEIREMMACPPPLPGHGRTPDRLRFLFEIGRRNLSLARLAEAHWDAVAILAEAGHKVAPNKIYGVWAAEAPGRSLHLCGDTLSGKKAFCSGAGMIDRALVTVVRPEHQLIDVDLDQAGLEFDRSEWHTRAFHETSTCTVTFNAIRICNDDLVGPAGFYLGRPGFWNGACGPAACWAGGAAGLVDWAANETRSDPHTLAHFGAMRADLWALQNLLDAAGTAIDRCPMDGLGAQIRALRVRHLVELHATDILRRLARAYGPHPLAFDEAVATRYQELDLYLRQSHAERDLQALGELERNQTV